MAGFLSIALQASAIEEPAWTLLETLGEVEVRQYEPRVQARTPMSAGTSSSGAFRTLAGYIFGGNAVEQEIAMTAPVEQTLGDAGSYMAFTMPREHSMDELPKPYDGSVSLHQVPSRVVAVVSFSGWARDSTVQEQVDVLLQALALHGLKARGEPSLAQYNPPWTLPWMRRNEVMVEIDGDL